MVVLHVLSLFMHRLHVFVGSVAVLLLLLPMLYDSSSKKASPRSHATIIGTERARRSSLHVCFCLARSTRVVVFFLQVVASAIVDKYIGESARVVREMFGYAKVKYHRRRFFQRKGAFSLSFPTPVKR